MQRTPLRAAGRGSRAGPARSDAGGSARAAAGFVLLPVVFAVALVAAVALLMNHETVTSVAVIDNDLDVARAEYAAQAGLRHALWHADRQGCGPFTDLADAPLDGAQYTTTLTSGSGSVTTRTVSVDQDGWIRADDTDKTHPNDAELHIRDEGGTKIERPVYRYDLSAIAAGSQVVSATAWFFVATAHPQGSVQVHRLTGDWTEADADWDLIGDEMDATVLASIPAQPTAMQWVSVNLTSQVQAWINGEPNHGIALHTDADGIHARYASREHSQQPYLVVVTGTPPGGDAALVSVATTVGGTTRTVKRAAATLRQSPGDYRHWQPDGADGKDAWVNQAGHDFNYGAAVDLPVSNKTANAELRSLLAFDLDSIPRGAAIVSAELTLFQHDGSADGGDIGVHRITRWWDEGDDDGTTGGGATWNSYFWGQQWTSPGGDFDATPVDSVTLPASTNAFYRWDLKDLVQGWVDGDHANHGVILVAATPGTTADFRSSDHANANERPQLTVTYRCACDRTCVAPTGGSGRVALVGDFVGFSPDDRDRAKEALFESWGFTVDQFDDNFLWTLNSDLYDAIYVSPTADPGAVGTQLTATDIGIVNQHGDLNDELGIAAGAAWPVGDTIDVSDVSHYITQPFVGGDLAVYDAPMEGLGVSGGVAAGGQVLARMGGSTALLAIDAGGALSGGGSAAGRRVLVPVGRSTDWSRMTSNAHLLLYRALAWAANVDGAPPPVCGDYTPIRQTGEFATTGFGSDTIKGLTYLPEGVAFKGTAAPAGGAWLIVDSADDRIYMTDMAGTELQDDSMPGNAPTGIAYIESGSYAGHLMLTDYNDGLYVLDMNGNEVANPSVPGVANPVGVSYIAATASATYDDAVAVLDVGGVVSIIDQSANSLHVQDYSADLSQPEDLAHIRGTDSLLIVDRGNDDVAKAGFEGGIASLYSTLAYGSAAPYAIAINSATCEHVIGDIGSDLVFALTDQPREPVAHWQMDDASGTTAVDAVGGHDGTLTNGPAWDGGQVGGALNLDGSDDHVVVPHDDALSLLDTMSFTAWINAAAFGSSYQTIVAKDGGGSGSNFWFGTWQDELVFGFWTGGFFREVYTNGLGLQADTWYHVAATFDNASNEVKLYVDGALVKTGPLTFAPTAVTAPLTLGRSPDGEYWDGLLDDVRIYDEVLGGAELVDLYETGGGTPATVPDPPPTGAGACPGSFADHFDARVFDGSNGTIDWSASPWQEIGESNGADAGDIRVTADQSNYQLRLRDNDNGGEGVSRIMDLSGADSATLTYRYRRMNLDTSSDYVRVEISATGGAPWTLLAEHAGPDNDGSYQTANHDISGHMSATTTLRLITSPSMGGTDTVWFDDVEASCVVTAPALALPSGGGALESR